MCSHHVNIIMLSLDYYILMQLQLIIIIFQQPVGRAFPMSYHDIGWHLVLQERFCPSFRNVWVFTDTTHKKILLSLSYSNTLSVVAFPKIVLPNMSILPLPWMFCCPISLSASYPDLFAPFICVCLMTYIRYLMHTAAALLSS